MKIVFISGHFNVLHPGHIRLFKFAHDLGHKLIVGVETDRLADSAAFIPENLRLEGVKSNSYVNEAFLFDRPIAEVIAELRPDIVLKGKEHQDRFNLEQDVVAKYGGVLLFASGDSVFTSSDLIRNEIENISSKLLIPEAYLARHGINTSKILEIIERFKTLNVLVIGDLIIDEYIACQPLGMSQEDPTIVVSPIESKKFIGGAGIVAAHAAGLGAHTSYLGIVGEDENHQFAKLQFESLGVSASLELDPGRPTTVKKRYRAHGKTLLRVSHLHQDAMPLSLQKKFLEKVLELMNGCDCLIFSDFNYGCLPQNLVDQIIAHGQEMGVLMSADSQSSSQIGDVARFRNMDLITPTEREARLSLKNQEDGLVVLAEKLRASAEAKHIMLKLGEDGLLVQTSSQNGDGIYTDQVQALNSTPKDVAGAGDSLLITSAMAMAAGANIWEMGLIGSIAAAIQVGRIGNVPLSADEVIRALEI